MLTFLAILPGVALLIYVYHLDKIEKEPFGLLLKLFIFGCIVVVPVAIVEVVLINITAALISTNSILYLAIENFLCVALIEEGFKYLALRLGSWKNKAFNYRFDGIVYAVCVSMGFAIVENILYVRDGGLSTAILRALMSVPGHCIFAVFMGYYYGLAKLQSKMGNPAKAGTLFKAILIPTLLHGAYDFMASCDSSLMSWLFLAFIVGLEIIAFIRIRKFSKEDMPMPY